MGMSEYSLDLRQRVLVAVARGMPRLEGRFLSHVVYIASYMDI